MSAYQEMHRNSGYCNTAQDVGNASILRQDSLSYSVSDTGSYFDDFMDESFEMYCDRMDSKEVVVIFENGMHPSQQYQGNHGNHEHQQQVDTMMQHVQALRLSQQDPTKSNVHDKNRPWQFPQPASNKENEVFRPQYHSTTAMAS
jgi:hypothetical protein